MIKNTTDREFLMQIHELLEYYGHNPLYADMYRLRSIIYEMSETDCTEADISQKNISLEKLKKRLIK